MMTSHPQPPLNGFIFVALRPWVRPVAADSACTRRNAWRTKVVALLSRFNPAYLMTLCLKIGVSPHGYYLSNGID